MCHAGPVTVTSIRSEQTARPIQQGLLRDVRLPSAVESALALVPSNPVARRFDPLLGDRPDFSEAECSGRDTAEFFDLGGEPAAQREVRRLCQSCPVQTDCMIWALRNEAHGMWGLSSTERTGLRGRSDSSHPSTPRRAAALAIWNGVDPDNLAAALRAVHGSAAQQSRPAHQPEALPEAI